MILRDSIDAPLIPVSTEVVAGYGDGKYIWSPSWKDGSNWFDLFPNSVKLVIVVSAAHVGDILDIENGDATPTQAPGWCKVFNRAGRRAPTLYCNRGTWPLVIDALRQGGVDPLSIDWWISTLDGTTNVSIPAGGKEPALVQVVDTGPYDESIILDPTWAGVDPLSLSAGLKTGLSHITFYSLYGRGPSTQELFDLANNINDDGSNFGDLVQGLAGNIPNPDVLRLQGTTLANDVDTINGEIAALTAKVDALPPASGFVPHTHVTDQGTAVN